MTWLAFLIMATALVAMIVLTARWGGWAAAAHFVQRLLLGLLP